MTSAQASERGIIATILNVPEAIYDATSAGITAASFLDGQNRCAFEAMADLMRARKPITRYHVTLAMSERYGPTPLAVYADAGGASRAFLPSFIRDVHSAEMARRIVGAGRAAIGKIEAGDAPAKVLAETQAELAASSAGSTRIRTMREIREEKVAEWRAACGRGFIDIQTAWPELDHILGGHRRKTVNVLGGYRGEGKSTLARQMGAAVAGRGIPVGLITMEDPDGIAGAGIAGALCGFSVYHLDTGNSHETPDEINAKWAGLDTMPLYIIDQPQTIGALLNSMQLLVARHGCQMIVIDHIQYILPSGKHQSRNEEIMRYSGAISAATKDLNIHALVLSQLSRDSEKENRRPRLSDLRDSGAIEQDARAVMLLYRSATDGKHRLDVAKNNNGPKGELQLEREDGRQRFICHGRITPEGGLASMGSAPSGGARPRWDGSGDNRE